MLRRREPDGRARPGRRTVGDRASRSTSPTDPDVRPARAARGPGRPVGQDRQLRRDRPAGGAPRAARAVGGAVGRNPIALLVPCHRVIAADGTLGGYGGDGPADRAEALERKRALLLREGVTVRPAVRLDSGAIGDWSDAGPTGDGWRDG